MNIDSIISQLKDERDRLTQAIAALEGSSSVTNRGGKKRGGNGITPEGRRRLSELMKKRWAARRKTTKTA